MHSYKYKVGVSQCVGGKWREKVNDEMLSAQHLYGNEVKVSIKNANDDSRLQAKQGERRSGGVFRPQGE